MKRRDNQNNRNEKGFSNALVETEKSGPEFNYKGSTANIL